MKFITKIKEAFNTKAGLAVAAAAAVPMLSSTSAHAALSTEAQGMVTAVTTAFSDLAGAVASMATANLGIAVAIVVGALVIGYALRAGRG